MWGTDVWSVRGSWWVFPDNLWRWKHPLPSFETSGATHPIQRNLWQLLVAISCGLVCFVNTSHSFDRCRAGRRIGGRWQTMLLDKDQDPSTSGSKCRRHHSGKLQRGLCAASRSDHKLHVCSLPLHNAVLNRTRVICRFITWYETAHVFFAASWRGTKLHTCSLPLHEIFFLVSYVRFPQVLSSRVSRGY